MRVAINMHCTFNFLFFVKKPKFFCSMVYSVLVWNIITMVTTNATILIYSTLVLLYPFYFIDIVQIKIFELATAYDPVKLKDYFSPYTRECYFVLITLCTTYLFLILNRNSPEDKNGVLSRYIERTLKRNEFYDKKYLIAVTKLITSSRKHFNSIHRYIPIFLSILTALSFISILNAGLLVFSLLFLWNSSLDRRYWKYFNSYIIFVIIIKQFGNYYLNLQNLNIEWLALIGIVTIEKGTSEMLFENRSVMIINLFLIYFSSTWYLELAKDPEQAEEKMRDPRDPRATFLKKKSIAEKLFAEYEFMRIFETIYRLLAVMFQYYTIWIFHLCANLILLCDNRDITVVILILVESIICFLHIVMWNRKDSCHPYSKIYKVWICKFYLIIFYAFFRYLTFFLKYQFIEEFTIGVLAKFGINGASHLLVGIRSIKKEDLYSPDEFIHLYSRPFLLLSIAVLTRESFLRYLKKEEMDEIGKKDYMKGLSKEKFEMDSDFSSDLKKITRKTNPFVVCYLVFKGLFLAVIMQKFHSNMNLIKLFMLICYLANMHSLFSKLIQLCTDMKLTKLFNLRINYFYLTFLTSKKWERPEEDQEKLMHFYTAQVEKRDLQQNKAYYEQFILRMEQILFQVNRIFWGLTFFPLLLLNCLIMTSNYFMKYTDSTRIQHILNIGFGVSRETWEDYKQINSELINNQIIICGLILEYMLTTYYFDCRSKLQIVPELDKLINALETKYSLLIDFHSGKIPKEKFDVKFAEYKDAMLYSWPEWNGRKRGGTVLFNQMKINENGVLTMVQSNEEETEDNRVYKSDESDDEEEESSEEVSSLENGVGKDYSSGEEKDTNSDKNISEKTIEIERKTRLLVNEEKPYRIYYMTELITKEQMLLFLYKNKYKYYLMKTFEGFLFAFTKFATLPLLYPIIRRINIVTLGFYIVFYRHGIMIKQTFLSDTKKKINLVIAFLLLQSIHLYLHTYFYTNSTIDNWYKKQINGLINNQNLINMIRPIESNLYSICYYWLFVNSLGFSIVPIFVWLSTKVLFREKQKRKDVFHRYLFDENRKRNVVIDYSLWRSSSIQKINWMYKYIYLNCLESHSFIILATIIYKFKSIYLWIFFFTMGISINEHFKIEQLNSEIDKVFRDRRTKRIMRIYVYSYWLMLLVSHFMDSLGNFGFFTSFNRSRLDFLAPLEAGLPTLILMIITGLFEDLIHSENYFEKFYKMKQESNLKVMYSNLCKAYDINELKIYRRIVGMMHKKTVDEISSQVLERTDKASTIVDLSQSHCAINMIRESFEWIIDKYLGFFVATKIRFLNLLYELIIHKSDKYRNEDILFLFHFVQTRNSKIIDHNSVNLEEYFGSDLSCFTDSFHKLQLYYSMLADGDTSKAVLYQKAFKQFINQDFTNQYEEFLQKMGSKLNPVLRSENISASRPPLIPIKSRRKHFIQSKEARSVTSVDLKRAADILVSTIRSKNDSKSLLTSFKLELQKRGSQKCMFGKMRIVLYNIRSDEILKTKGYNEVNLNTLFKFVPRVLITNSEYIVAISLVYIQIMNGGCLSFFNLGIIVFTIFIEETSGRSFWWRVLYSSYLANVVCRRTYTLFPFLENNPLLVEFFLGNLKGNYDIVAVFLVMYTIELLKKYGIGNKSAVDFENPGLAMARLTINNDFENMIHRIIKEEMKKKEQLNLFLGSKIGDSRNGITLKDFKMILIRQVIKNYTKVRLFKMKFLHYSQKLLKVLRFDYLKIGPSDLNSFFFRNFSRYLRKTGQNYDNTLSSLLFIVILIYILMVFPTLSPPKTGLASFLIKNSVTGFMVLNFSVYLTFFLLQYYFDQMKNIDTEGLCSKDYSLNLMHSFDCTKPEKDVRRKPILRLKELATKIRTLVTFTKISKNSKDDYKQNPQYYHLLCCFILWVYVNFVVFFWAPLEGNFRSEKKSGISKFLCEAEDKGTERMEMDYQECRSFTNNPYTQAFYLLNIVYLVTVMLQFKAGKPLQASKIIDFSKGPVNTILFNLYLAVPLIRETRVTLEYCSTKTSLWFSDFVLLKDLECLLQKAKIEFGNNMKSKTGKQLARWLQYTICWIAVALIMLLGAGPLYLFYNSSNASFFDIDGASLQIDLMMGKNLTIANLYSGTKLLVNEDMILYESEEKKKLFSEIQGFSQVNRYTKAQYAEIGFSRYSEYFLKLTPKLIEDVRLLVDENADLRIKTNLTILVG